MDLRELESTGTSADSGPRQRRWRWIAGVAVVVLALAVFVLVWFQPQKLFIDERVDQAVPTAQPSAPSAGAEADQEGTAANDAESGGAPTGQSDAPAPPTTAPPGPVDLATGEFVSRDHPTSGTARVLELADGRRFVRLEGFETDNGPDLFVYLSANPADGPEGAFDDAYHNLGRLQGNVGDQNYEIPTDVSLDGFASVVIWCDRFDSAFGAAALTPA
jgi:hypothetical protein